MEPSPQLHGALQTVVLALQHSSFWTDVRDLLIVRSINAGRLVGGGRLPSGLRLLLVLLVVLVVLVGGGRQRERDGLCFRAGSDWVKPPEKRPDGFKCGS